MSNLGLDQNSRKHMCRTICFALEAFLLLSCLFLHVVNYSCMICSLLQGYSDFSAAPTLQGGDGLDSRYSSRELKSSVDAVVDLVNCPKCFRGTLTRRRNAIDLENIACGTRRQAYQHSWRGVDACHCQHYCIRFV